MLSALTMLAATPAVAADQFDLVCQGTVTSIRIGATDFQLAPGYSIPGPEPISFRIRADLDRSVYCEDACSNVIPITGVTPEVVGFKSTVRSVVVSRRDGSFVGSWAQAGNRDAGIPLLRKDATGACQRAPFSGFPSTLF